MFSGALFPAVSKRAAAGVTADTQFPCCKLVQKYKHGRELMQDALDNMKLRLGDALPRVQDVLGLTQCSDILTLDDFFDLYYSPNKCLGSPLDSEVVWPLPPSLNF